MSPDTKPLILVADDDPLFLAAVRHHLSSWGYRVVIAADKAQLLDQLAGERPCAVLLDLRLRDQNGVEILQRLVETAPGLNVVMMTAHGSIDSAVAAIKLGAYDYLTKPPDLNRLRVVLGHAAEQHGLTRRIERLQQLVDVEPQDRPLWGDSPVMRQLRDRLATVAAVAANVLILGESGTGKELAARAVHEQSPRRQGPFVPVNVAALPRELVESTLFGHERGAFTSADQAHEGCCEAAEGGTLFLDEIGEMDVQLQAKLLRFVQERTFQRVGSSRVRSADVRIVSATNRDLREQVRQNAFREDLYYRLNVVPILMPALRDHPEDVPILAARFLRRAAVRNGRSVESFSESAIQALMAYDWPGNVRQLENLIERLVIFTTGPEIGLDAIPAEVRRPSTHDRDGAAEGYFCDGAFDGVSTDTPLSAGPPLRAIDVMEKLAIQTALTRSNGNVREAARALGLGQATVYRKIKRYGLTGQHPRG